jgi:hypothetical protein
VRTQKFEASRNRPYVAADIPPNSGVECEIERSVHKERTWRCPADVDRSASAKAAILVSRWTMRVTKRSTCLHPIVTLLASL